jgi:hypothetical protein
VWCRSRGSGVMPVKTTRAGWCGRCVLQFAGVCLSRLAFACKCVGAPGRLHPHSHAPCGDVRYSAPTFSCGCWTSDQERPCFLLPVVRLWVQCAMHACVRNPPPFFRSRGWM